MAAIPSAMKYATTLDDVRIAYMSHGDGPSIVFASNIFGDLTGYRTGWPHMKEVTDRLVRLGWRVIRYDVRGMGYSDRNVADVGPPIPHPPVSGACGLCDMHRRRTMVAEEAGLSQAADADRNTCAHSGGDDPPLPSRNRTGDLTMFGLAEVMFLLALCVHDRRTWGGVHAATLWGGGLLLITAVSRTLIAGTDAWLAFAKILIQ